MSSRFAVIALALATLGGCAVVQEKTIGESFDDASASGQIKSRLLAASPGRFADVGVEVTGRLALLTGRVDVEEDRARAEQIAWQVRAIDEVANELIVGEDGGIKRMAGDEWITTQVRMRLVGDAAVKGVNYNIETSSGVVYLLGLARSQDELMRVADHASRVSGVERVVSYVKMRNRMEPLPAPAYAETAPQEPAYAPAYQPAYPEQYAAQPAAEPVDSWGGSVYSDPYSDTFGDNAPSNDGYGYTNLAGGSN